MSRDPFVEGQAVGAVAVALLVAMCVSVGCTREQAKTANDVARVACEQWAVGEAERLGITVSEVVDSACQAREVLDIFLGHQKAAHDAASAEADRMGLGKK